MNDTTTPNSTTSPNSLTAPTPGPASPVTPRPQERRGNTITRFIRESRIELRNVTWPTREQVINLTIVVVVVCALMGVFTGVLDYVFTSLIRSFIVG